MSRDAIMYVLSEAAHKRAIVNVSVRTDHGVRSTEIEPYSIHKRSGVPTLFCWDVSMSRVVGLPVEKLDGAHSTAHKFTPRYEIEL